MDWTYKQAVQAESNRWVATQMINAIKRQEERTNMDKHMEYARQRMTPEEIAEGVRLAKELEGVCRNTTAVTDPPPEYARACLEAMDRSSEKHDRALHAAEQRVKALRHSYGPPRTLEEYLVQRRGY